MCNKKEDRRVQRTRNMLFEAFMDLLLEKGYDAITVQDIIDGANVGRSTFYSHFTDKEHLLRDSIDQLKGFLKEQSLHRPETTVSGEYRFGFSLGMLEHIQSHKRIYKATVSKKGGAMVLQQMQRMLGDLVRDEITVLFPSSTGLTLTPELIVEYVVNTFLTLMTWWVGGSGPASAAELDKLFHQLTLTGLKGLEPSKK